MLTERAFCDILKQVQCPGFAFHLRYKGADPYLQVEFDQVCNTTGKSQHWRGRKWTLSPHMTESEVVQTAFKAVLTAVEHETREQFKFMGQPIFDPHYDVRKLVALRAATDSISTREAKP